MPLLAECSLDYGAAAECCGTSHESFTSISDLSADAFANSSFTNANGALGAVNSTQHLTH